MNSRNADQDSIPHTLVFKTPNSEESLNRLEIRSARLTMRPMSPNNIDDVFREFTDEITYFMVPRAPEKREESEYFIQTCQSALADGTDIVLAILDKRSEVFIGCAGLNVRDNALTPELGIWIKKSAHGQGFGREAITALHSWAIFHLDVDHFIYPVDRENRPSRKIAESLGGEIFMEAEKLTHHGRMLDEVIYRIPNTKPVKTRSGIARVTKFFLRK